MPDSRKDLRETDIDIELEMRDSFMTFAMSVITARALPGCARRPEAVAAAHPLSPCTI